MFSMWLFGLLALPAWGLLIGLILLGKKIFPNSGEFEIDSDWLTAACVALVAGLIPILSLISLSLAVALSVLMVGIMLSEYAKKWFDL